MKTVPVITGIGLVTALGRCANDTWNALLAGQCITDHTRVDSILRPDLPRVTGLAIEAATEAIAQAQWNQPDDRDTAVIIGTSKGPVEKWLMPYAKSQVERSAPSTFGLAEIATDIAAHVGFTSGPKLTLSAACASGLHALISGCMLIQSGRATRVLVVATEASVHPLFIASFSRLGVLPSAGQLCRPFDVNREGFLMSDAAAAVCLEADDKTNGIRIDRYAMAGDATHLTGSKSDGKTLGHLLRQSMPPDIDLIHAHGTGTLLNDALEIQELQAALQTNHAAVAGYDLPQIFSHKGALGHTLGASGLISVAINCLCHHHSKMPGNINTQQPIPHQRLRISPATISRPIRKSLAIASGFGGPIAMVNLVS